jgi:hypothetical protein
MKLYQEKFVEVSTDPNITELIITCNRVIIHPQPNLVKLEISVNGNKIYKLPYFPKLEYLKGYNIQIDYFDNLHTLILSHSKIKNFKIKNITQIQLRYCSGKVFIPSDFVYGDVVRDFIPDKKHAYYYYCPELRKAPIGCAQGECKLKNCGVHCKDYSYNNVFYLSDNKYLKKLKDLR